MTKEMSYFEFSNVKNVCVVFPTPITKKSTLLSIQSEFIKNNQELEEFNFNFNFDFDFEQKKVCVDKNEIIKFDETIEVEKKNENKKKQQTSVIKYDGVKEESLIRKNKEEIREDIFVRFKINQFFRRKKKKEVLKINIDSDQKMNDEHVQIKRHDKYNNQSSIDGMNRTHKQDIVCKNKKTKKVFKNRFSFRFGKSRPNKSKIKKSKKDIVNNINKNKKIINTFKISLKKLVRIFIVSRKFIFPNKSLNHNCSSKFFLRYESVGKLLGSGSNGSVSVVALKSDPSRLFAVKKFRSKTQLENTNDYSLKVCNEYKIGKFLKHENLIETIELIKDLIEIDSSYYLNDYYIVMEYCSYDFFTLVMSGLMKINEIFCYIKQIINGVAYLHNIGLAHRDLKLDNCVVDKNGILKLIDFGSAVQFKKEKSKILKYPSNMTEKIDENFFLIKVKGIVGSDPYLAPEVFDQKSTGYDPRLVDVWSIAIIFCCLYLRRFPWKLPKLSDPSYKSFFESFFKKPFISEELNYDSINNNDNKSQKLNTLVINQKKKKKSVKLFDLLPLKSRKLIRSMLTIDTNKRFFISDVISDPFYLKINCCSYKNNQTKNKTISHSSHVHHLITEKELQILNIDKKKIKKLKNTVIC